MISILPSDHDRAVLVGRVWRSDVDGPAICVIKNGGVFDITSVEVPTMRDLLELEDPVDFVKASEGEYLGKLNPLTGEISYEHSSKCCIFLIAPCDLQAIKACGVTFVKSMIERVIEEKCVGDSTRASEIRDLVSSIIGDTLSNIVPGSSESAAVKEALVSEGIWSQYLEVGIGPDAEVFTKSQPLSAVGFGADIGLHPNSRWNNPEPEVVLAVNSRFEVKGASLGNDVNLRDIEGRSALLLGKAKDNNASCAIGPFIRLFDEHFNIDHVRSLDVNLLVKGDDGYCLNGTSSMSEISRDPLDLVAQTAGRFHQYPDGFMLFLGTLFAPTEDRDVQGSGFTHKLGDKVTIHNERLGRLFNIVKFSTECAEWNFGASHLMRNLASRGLI